MSFGYGAFGSQEWIRKIKPKPYFERRKSPAGEKGDITINPDYHQLMQKQGIGQKLEPREKVEGYKLKWPLKMVIVLFLLALVSMLIWMYLQF